MYLERQKQLAQHIRSFLREKYQIELLNIVIDAPPKVEMGEFAMPFSFELAKQLRKAPRKIAEEIVAEMPLPEGFEKFEVAGAGYINARLKRDLAAQSLASGTAAIADHEGEGAADVKGKILVEHTSINPNKAAHIGHLRNAILGDTFVRLLRAAGHTVDVQNYIDNTGVQVADVVVGFVHLEKLSKAQIEALIARRLRGSTTTAGTFTREFRSGTSRTRLILKCDLKYLHAIEQGNNEMAEIADLVSTAVLRRHLETMERLDIEYDFLPRESEILHLHFWDLGVPAAQRKGRAVLRDRRQEQGLLGDDPSGRLQRSNSVSLTKLTRRPSEKKSGPDEDAKVIVRSNGTVGYVGKDIAYHLWKFGLLGRDFGYQKFFHYPNGHECWISAEQGEADHPHFGSVEAIYNVIDSRQSDPQNTVVEAIRLLGYPEQGRSLHPLFLRDGGADPALCDRPGLRSQRRRPGQVLHRGFRTQGVRRQGRRPARSAYRSGQNGSGCSPP